MQEKRQVNGNLAIADKQQRVIVIDAREKPQDIKLRVAAYARVSTDSADQLNSFTAQNNYYTTLIASKENWTMVDIYADCGISGISAKKREEFQRLLADCRKGCIDRVLCKSISRFARNTKECLEIIRELKSLGIGVCFEKEGINTATMSGEMLTAIFASVAQSESESISGNMRWSYLQRMESGEFITCSAPFGYRLAGRELEIYEPEAALVRDIFRRYLAGDSVDKIVEYMNTLGIPTGEGTPYWQRTSIIYILTNEKYVGNALLQKRYTTETLPYQSKVNHGERPKHLVLGSHPAIISTEVFEKVQELFQSRSKTAPHRSGVSYPLSHSIVCGNCGSAFKRRVNGGITYWVCCRHEQKKDRCPIIQIAESQFYNAFCRLYYKLKRQGADILQQMLTHFQTVRRHRMLWSADVVELNKRISNITSQNQLLAMLKQQGGVDPDIFISRSNELAEQLRNAKQEKERLLSTSDDETIAQTQELMEIIDAGPDFLEEFDTELFGELVERIIVESSERIRFRLKNGLELAENIERMVR